MIPSFGIWRIRILEEILINKSIHHRNPGILVLLAVIFLYRPLAGKSARIKSYADVSPKTSMSLSQMSKRYGLRSLTVNGKQITLLTKFNTILLEGDSRKATFNKVNIWLNGPITRRWGSWRICQADIDRTIWPLLNPDKALASEKYQVVVL